MPDVRFAYPVASLAFVLAVGACGGAARPAAEAPVSEPEPPAQTAPSSSGGEATAARESASDDNAADAARQLAGPGAADCGRAGFGENRARVDDCVVATMRGGSAPFYAGYETREDEQEVIEYFVRDRSGAVYRLRTAPAPVGSDRAHRRIERSNCPEPHVANFDGVPRLSCRALVQ